MGRARLRGNLETVGGIEASAPDSPFISEGTGAIVRPGISKPSLARCRQQGCKLGRFDLHISPASKRQEMTVTSALSRVRFRLLVAACTMLIGSMVAAHASTPMALAARAGDLAALRQLLATGADPVEKATDSVGTVAVTQSPLDWALQEAQVEAVRLLLSVPRVRAEALANDTFGPSLRRLGAHVFGRVPACDRDAACRERVIGQVRLLLSSGFDPNGRPGIFAPLCHAVFSASANYSPETGEEVVKLLLQAGANARHSCRSDKAGTAITFGIGLRSSLVQLLLAHGADPSDRRDDGVTPLTAAVNAGSPEVVALLLRSGARPNVADGSGQTPLHLAATVAKRDLASGVDIANSLLAAGADPNARNRSGETPLEVFRASDGFPMAGKASPNEFEKLLMGHGGVESQAVSRRIRDLAAEDYPIHNAIMFGMSAAEFDLLLQLAGRWLDRPDPAGTAPLHLAVLEASLNGRSDYVPSLLRRGADPNVRAASAQQETPLILAAGSRAPLFTIVDALIKAGAAVNAQDRFGASALIWASIRGNVAIAARLLEAGANVELADLNGLTPLAHAIAQQQPGIVGLLLRRGVDPNRPIGDPTKGITPLRLALHVKHEEMVTLLRNAGARESAAASVTGEASGFADGLRLLAQVMAIGTVMRGAQSGAMSAQQAAQLLNLATGTTAASEAVATIAAPAVSGAGGVEPTRSGNCRTTLAHLDSRLPRYRDGELEHLRQAVLRTDLQQALQAARAQGLTPSAAAKAALDQARAAEHGGPAAESCIRNSALNPVAVLEALRNGSFDFSGVTRYGPSMHRDCAKGYVAYYYQLVANREAATGMACLASIQR